ncbi:MAG: Lrp/AsnC family transcriptional regulator [Victivallaceae bacterium]
MLDNIDKEILRCLQQNARMTNVAIAKQVEIAPSAVLKRIRRLEQDGIIIGYEARVNNLAVDCGMSSFVLVATGEKPGSLDVGRKIAELPEVQEVHFTAGDYYYLLKVRTKDPNSHNELIKKLGDIGVKDCRTTLVLKTVKETLQLDI